MGRILGPAGSIRRRLTTHRGRTEIERSRKSGFQQPTPSPCRSIRAPTIRRSSGTRWIPRRARRGPFRIWCPDSASFDHHHDPVFRKVPRPRERQQIPRTRSTMARNPCALDSGGGEAFREFGVVGWRAARRTPPGCRAPRVQEWRGTNSPRIDRGRTWPARSRLRHSETPARESPPSSTDLGVHGDDLAGSR